MIFQQSSITKLEKQQFNINCLYRDRKYLFFDKINKKSKHKILKLFLFPKADGIPITVLDT